MCKRAALHACAVILSLLCTTVQRVTTDNPHGYAEAYNQALNRSFDFIYLSNEGPEYTRSLDFRTQQNGNLRPDHADLALDAGFTFTAYVGDNVVGTQDGPFVGQLSLGRFDRMEVTYVAPPAFGPTLPTYDESEIEQLASTYHDLIYNGFLPWPGDGSNLVARGEPGAVGKGPDCFRNAGSYQQSCSSGVWAVKGKSPGDDCWLCATCPPDGGPSATTCTQAFNTCDDISYDVGTINCHVNGVVVQAPLPSSCSSDCGADGQPCCDGGICCGEGSICSTTDGVCLFECGEDNKPCCRDRCFGDGSLCVNGTCKPPS